MPTIEELEQWMSTSQVASRLGKTRQGVLWMLKDRRLRAAKTTIGWLIDPASVERLREEENGNCGR